MIKHAIYVAIAFCLAALFLLRHSFALENIIRPYQGVRSSGMGGVKLTTGFYEENFWGNPARATANPERKIQLFDLSLETTFTTIKNISSIIGGSGGSDLLGKLSSVTGKNNHVRTQITFPGIYVPLEKMSYALAIQVATQADIDIRKSYSIDPGFVTDVGPSFTVARKFLEGDELSVGLTAHLTYRISSKEGYSFVDFIKGKSLSPTQNGGEGTQLDFDLGGTYQLPWKWKEWDFGTSLAINNLLGGKFSNISIHPLNLGSLPTAQPRTLGLGVVAHKEEVWKFSNLVLALEFTDIGNNTNGSLWRTIHIGSETHFGVLAPRLGINQGYLCLGFGVQFKAFIMDFATYGEEMSLNAGGLEDRRFALRFLFQI